MEHQEYNEMVLYFAGRRQSPDGLAKEIGDREDGELGEALVLGTGVGDDHLQEEAAGGLPPCAAARCLPWRNLFSDIPDEVPGYGLLSQMALGRLAEPGTRSRNSSCTDISPSVNRLILIFPQLHPQVARCVLRGLALPSPSLLIRNGKLLREELVCAFDSCKSSPSPFPSLTNTDALNCSSSMPTRSNQELGLKAYFPSLHS